MTDKYCGDVHTTDRLLSDKYSDEFHTTKDELVDRWVLRYFSPCKVEINGDVDMWYMQKYVFVSCFNKRVQVLCIAAIINV